MSPAICRAYSGSRCRRGVSIRERTRGCAGTISVPVPVATSTSRRHRFRCWTAKCCASPPPHDRPRTSTGSSKPSRLSIPATTGLNVDRLYGTTGRGEPPTPGTSKRTTVRRGCSASTKGCSTSRLAPMPFISSSGGTSGSVPARTETRSARPPAVMVCTFSAGRPAGLVLADIGTRRLSQHLELTAEVLRRGDLLPGPLAQPGGEVRPPRALDRLRPRQPLLRVGRRGVGDLEGRLRVARRVDQRRDVPVGGEDEAGVAAEQLRGAVAGLPR